MAIPKVHLYQKWTMLCTTTMQKRDELRLDEEADPNIDVNQTSDIVLPHRLSNSMHELKDAALR